MKPAQITPGGPSDALDSSREPSAPSRVRIVRPSFYRSEATGALPPDVRDLLVGLTTLADDAGWMLWRPGELAAALYPYQPVGRRLRDLERRAARLQADGLVDVRPCGCAHLPSLQRDHSVKGGSHSATVWTWHQGHDGQVRTATDKSRPSSSSSSSSVKGSSSGSGSDSSRARETDATELPRRNGAGSLYEEMAARDLAVPFPPR